MRAAHNIAPGPLFSRVVLYIQAYGMGRKKKFLIFPDESRRGKTRSPIRHANQYILKAPLPVYRGALNHYYEYASVGVNRIVRSKAPSRRHPFVGAPPCCVQRPRKRCCVCCVCTCKRTHARTYALYIVSNPERVNYYS